MIFWILYLSIDGDFTKQHPFHFFEKGNCEIVGTDLVKRYKYEKFRCVKEVYE